MIIDKPGKVTDKILLLGRKESCVYLLKGNGEYALVGGGTAYIIPDVLEQLKRFEIEEEKIKQIIIQHSHFDHCGMVPFLKKCWPQASVTASARAKELLATPKIVESIRHLNQMLVAEHGREKQSQEMGFDFSGVDVEVVVKDKDIISCGDLSMEVIDVPGHSSCSIAVYVSQEKAMFGSDAGGIPIENRIFTAANSNFDKYQKSLEKMASYEIDIYLAEHFGARLGDDARGYLFQAMGAASETRRMMEASYARTKDVNKSTQEITNRFMQWVPENFMPRDIIAMVTGQMLRYIAKQKEINGWN